MVAVLWRMCGRVLLLLLLYAAPPFQNRFAGAAEVDEDNMPHLGHSIDLLPRYGYFALSMKVVSRNESDQGWIFREPAVDVFTNIRPYAAYESGDGAASAASSRGLDSTSESSAASRQIFHGDFHMEFCDNSRQLVQAYFRDFQFELLDRPWRAFSASWSAETIAKHMGINASFVYGDYCYVLVRLNRVRQRANLTRMPPNIDLSDMVARDVAAVRAGDGPSLMNFIRRIGSHYVNAYVTGNSLYQVYVYKKTSYKQIRQRLSTRGISQMNSMELSSFFSPWYADHMGVIKTASGNRTVEMWAARKLRTHYYIFAYPSLLKIHGNTELLAALNTLLRNEALLEIDMRSLSPVFKEPVKRAWFDEVLKNFMHLLEENL